MKMKNMIIAKANMNLDVSFNGWNVIIYFV